MFPERLGSYPAQLHPVNAMSNSYGVDVKLYKVKIVSLIFHVNTVSNFNSVDIKM